MQSADYWRLCDHLSFFQAIMLVLGFDPANQSSGYVESHRKLEVPEGYAPLKAVLLSAIKSNKLEADVVYYEDEGYGNQSENTRMDLDATVISVKSLKDFLKEKGFTEGFFFPQGGILESYLDPESPYFAPKLSAAINAWKAVTDNPDTQKGKTPKQALEKWLRENASKYGLTKDDGSPNETGIEEICKIANWKPEGGAAKTPSIGMVQPNPPTPLLTIRKLKVFGEKIPQSTYAPEWDGEEIPF